jgi:hypothetical protein
MRDPKEFGCWSCRVRYCVAGLMRSPFQYCNRCKEPGWRGCQAGRKTPVSGPGRL